VFTERTELTIPEKVVKTSMLSSNGDKDNGGSIGSEQGLCNSQLSKVHGLNDVKIRKRFGRGSVLFAEGQSAKGIYVLCEGKAKVSITSSEGHTFLLRIAEPGELLGLNATLIGQPHPATVQTLEPCVVDFVGRADLLRLLEKDKTSYLSVLQSLCNELVGLIDHSRLVFLSQSAPEKLARLLLKWCDQSGTRTTQGIRITPGLTHEEIAHTIRASRETVTRAFNVLKRKDILHAENGHLIIRNRSALMALIE
jgi:CRP/FNR family transcriptional regulator, cyclic AMP receptor protein